MVESVKEAHPKEQTTVQKAWVTGDSTIALVPGFKTFNAAEEMLSLFFDDGATEYADYERYHNSQDWICVGGTTANGNTPAASACQGAEPGTDVTIWGLKPMQPGEAVMPYSHTHLVKKNDGPPLPTDWSEMYKLISDVAWTPFEAPTTEEFKDDDGSGTPELPSGAARAGTDPYDDSNTGFILNLIYYSDSSSAYGSPSTTYDAYDIRRSVMYNQWCHKKFYRGYQYRPGQKLCVYKDIITDDAETNIDAPYVYASGKSGAPVVVFAKPGIHWGWDEGEMAQMNPTYFQSGVADNGSANDNKQLIFTPHEMASRSQNTD